MSSHVLYLDVLFKFTSSGKSYCSGSTVCLQRELEYFFVFGVAQKGHSLCPWVIERTGVEFSIHYKCDCNKERAKENAIEKRIVAQLLTFMGEKEAGKGKVLGGVVMVIGVTNS